MQRFFQSLSAFLGIGTSALVVLIVLVVQPVRLGAEAAPPPPEDGGIDASPPVDGSVDAETAPEPATDAAPGSADATPPTPVIEDSDGCRVAPGRGRPTSVAILAVALVAGVLARRRRS